jgi:hypothetical protein
MKDIQQWEAVKTTTLTASGGATPSVTGPTQYLGQVDSNFSCILENSGASTSLSVTYQIGFLATGITEEQAVRDPSNYITWATPEDGGAVAGMTTLNIAGSNKHVSLTLAVCKWYRFIITNNDAVNGAGVRLSLIAQY